MMVLRCSAKRGEDTRSSSRDEVIGMLHVSYHLSLSFIALAHATPHLSNSWKKPSKTTGRRMSVACDETGTMRMRPAGFILAHFVYRGPPSNRKHCYVFRFRFFACRFTEASSSGGSLRSNLRLISLPQRS